jgi:hypothetical protein
VRDAFEVLAMRGDKRQGGIVGGQQDVLLMAPKVVQHVFDELFGRADRTRIDHRLFAVTGVERWRKTCGTARHDLDTAAFASKVREPKLKRRVPSRTCHASSSA